MAYDQFGVPATNQPSGAVGFEMMNLRENNGQPYPGPVGM